MKNVEDVYPLSPMQEMMLLHALTVSDADVLFNQFCYQIQGDLEVSAFRRAWEQIVERHPILRTAFLWKDLDKPLQVVRKRVELPFEHLDWRDVSSSEQEEKLERLRAEDRGRRFDPARAPLMRLTLVRLAEDGYFFIWSSHHLLFDRWCLSVVLDELVKFYEANRRGETLRLPAPGSFRDYIRWIAGQNRSEARAYWSEALGALSKTTPLAVSREEGDRTARKSDECEHGIELSDEETHAIRAFARAQHLTVSTVFQGAWALLVNHYTESQDVVFGAAVSGRPPDLGGVDSIVGSFINNLPVRIPLPADASLLDWLKGIQNRQQERAPFEYVSVADIQRWADWPPGQPLFDTILVWLSSVDAPRPEGLELHGLNAGVRTVYPVTLGVDDGATRISLRLQSARGHRTRVESSEILPRLASLLESVVADPHRRLAELDGFRSDGDVSSEKKAVTETQDQRGVEDPDKLASPLSAEGREGEEPELIESLLLEEWRSILKLDGIGPDDNFFDLGGNSLLAVSLHARIEAIIGRAVPLLALFQGSTVKEMAQTICERKWPLRPSTLRAIQPRGSRRPLFCVASPEVNTLGFVLLARHLGEDQPVYVLQSPPRSEETAFFVPSELPGVAREYIEAMESVQGEGSYQLLGMCGGSHLTVEMARQLHAAGKSLHFVGVINTWSLHTLSWLFRFNRVFNRLRYYAGRLRGLWRLDFRTQLQTVGGKVRRGMNSLFKKDSGDVARESHGTAAIDETPPDGGEEAQRRERDRRMRQRDQEWYRFYRPEDVARIEKYRGTVTVFRIRKQQYFRIRDPELGWGQHAEKVEIRHLGAPEQLVILREPHVQELARKLAPSLDREEAS